MEQADLGDILARIDQHDRARRHAGPLGHPALLAPRLAIDYVNYLPAVAAI